MLQLTNLNWGWRTETCVPGEAVDASQGLVIFNMANGWFRQSQYAQTLAVGFFSN